jgi:hypothetical protein
MLKCIDNENFYSLTIGKLYDNNAELEEEPGKYYYLQGDDGIWRYYDKERFIDIQQLRHNKLNELGI